MSMMAGMGKERWQCHGPTGRSLLKETSVKNCQGILRGQAIWNIFCHIMVDHLNRPKILPFVFYWFLFLSWPSPQYKHWCKKSNNYNPSEFVVWSNLVKNSRCYDCEILCSSIKRLGHSERMSLGHFGIFGGKGNLGNGRKKTFFSLRCSLRN